MKTNKLKVVIPPMCDHSTTIGSYPGEGFASCNLPPGHGGDHEGTYTWEQMSYDCNTCPNPE